MVPLRENCTYNYIERSIMGKHAHCWNHNWSAVTQPWTAELQRPVTNNTEEIIIHAQLIFDFLGDQRSCSIVLNYWQEACMHLKYQLESLIILELSLFYIHPPGQSDTVMHSHRHSMQPSSIFCSTHYYIYMCRACMWKSWTIWI